jgi:hypothetical protein
MVNATVAWLNLAPRPPTKDLPLIQDLSSHQPGAHTSSMAFFRNLKQSLQLNFPIFHKRKRSNSLSGGREGQSNADDDVSSLVTPSTRQLRSLSLDAGTQRAPFSIPGSDSGGGVQPKVEDSFDSLHRQQQQPSTPSAFRPRGRWQSSDKYEGWAARNATCFNRPAQATSAKSGKATNDVDSHSVDDNDEVQRSDAVPETIGKTSSKLKTKGASTVKQEETKPPSLATEEGDETFSESSERSLDRRIDEYLSELERLVFNEWNERAVTSDQVPPQPRIGRSSTSTARGSSRPDSPIPSLLKGVPAENSTQAQGLIKRVDVQHRTAETGLNIPYVALPGAPRPQNKKMSPTRPNPSKTSGSKSPNTAHQRGRSPERQARDAPERQARDAPERQARDAPGRTVGSLLHDAQPELLFATGSGSLDSGQSSPGRAADTRPHLAHPESLVTQDQSINTDPLAASASTQTSRPASPSLGKPFRRPQSGHEKTSSVDGPNKRSNICPIHGRSTGSDVDAHAAGGKKKQRQCPPLKIGRKDRPRQTSRKVDTSDDTGSFRSTSPAEKDSLTRELAIGASSSPTCDKSVQPGNARPVRPIPTRLGACADKDASRHDSIARFSPLETRTFRPITTKLCSLAETDPALFATIMPARPSPTVAVVIAGAGHSSNVNSKTTRADSPTSRNTPIATTARPQSAGKNSAGKNPVICFPFRLFTPNNAL